MDLSSPLRSLIPSLDSAVLEALAGVQSSLSITQITKLSKRGTRQGLTLALDRLVDHGLVTATPANRGSMYRLNRQHVLADAVISAADARATILTRLTEHTEQMTPTPVHVSVFGSFARREADPTSDIDVLFVLPEAVDPSWFEQAAELSDLVHAWTGNRMEYLAFSLVDLTGVVDRHEPIVDSWLNDCVTIYGPPIETLVRDI